MATADKLQKLITTKANIKAALIEKGITNPGDKFSDYPDLIRQIQGGESGGSDINLSDATATAADILYPKTAYTSSGKVEGTIQTWDGTFIGGVKAPDMLQARVDATNSCSYLMYNYEGTDVSFLSGLDTSEVTNMGSMFSGCKNITSFPDLDTSNVTDMRSMFYNCNNLTNVPLFDTSNVTYMGAMFQGCSNLTNVPLFDTSNVTYMGAMFNGCSNLTNVPLFDTSEVTYMGYIFQYCTNLTTVPAFDTSNVTSMSTMFNGCRKLKSILMYGMKVDFSISSSTQFEREDLVTILNNLGTVTTATTLTMGSTNLAKLTDADKEIATEKGWTLA